MEEGDGAGALFACTLPESDNKKTKKARTTSLCTIVTLYDVSEVKVFWFRFECLLCSFSFEGEIKGI